MSSINSTTSTACRAQTELTGAILRLEQARIMIAECRSAKLLIRTNAAIYSNSRENNTFSETVDGLTI